MANMTVFSAMVDWRNRIDRRREPGRIRLAVNNHIGKGGHLSSQPMGALRDYIAKDPVTERFSVVNFPVRHDNPYRIDLEATAEVMAEIDPEIIIFGKSMVLHPEPVAEVKAMVVGKEDPPILMYDMAHVLGLVGRHFQEPFVDGADLVTGSTHKTFFGSQRGVVAGNFAEDSPKFGLWKAIRRSVGTAVRRHRDEHLQGRVSAKGHRECQGVRPGPGRRGPRCAGRPRFTVSSGLRLGVAEMTRFGMDEADFEEFAGLFAAAIRDEPGIAEAVAEFRGRFQTMRYCLDAADFGDVQERLLKTF